MIGTMQNEHFLETCTCGGNQEGAPFLTGSYCFRSLYPDFVVKKQPHLVEEEE